MSTNPLDSTKIATDLSLRAIERVVTMSGNIFRKYWRNYKARDAATYAEYLVRKGVSANSIRNFIYSNTSASLYDIYVPTRFTTASLHRSKDHSGDALLQWASSFVSTNPQHRPTLACVILGPAGSGKSLFMRHAFFALQNMSPFRIPILIEVRWFNRVGLDDLRQRIVDDVQSTGVNISHAQITAALQSGLFFILLDGLDELRTSLPIEHSKGIQQHYESELLAFATKFPLCPIFVSTRPMQTVHSWSQFEVRQIARLDLRGTMDLVNRLEFHSQVKQKFKTLLRTRLFESHYELVSVPLLCIIMLLTYSETGYIANYRHEFFEDAFNALWSKHDGRKDGFVRERQSGLKRSEFLQLLSAFAMSSYNSSDYDMRDAHIDKHFVAALKLSGVKCDQEKFVQDFTTSTSLGIYDGPYLRFYHRSFQEYFAAVFLAQIDDDNVGQLIEEISDRLETDSVLPLLLSINPEKIEKHWVQKKLLEIEGKLELIGEEGYRDYVLSKAKKDAKIHKAMSQIRLLYQFSHVQAAIDANRHMQLSGDRIDGGVAGSLLRKDYRKLLEISRQISEKYSDKSSALRQMLTEKASI